MNPTPEQLAQQAILTLSRKLAAMGEAKHVQVTRALLEAAAWHITYKGEPDGQ